MSKSLGGKRLLFTLGVAGIVLSTAVLIGITAQEARMTELQQSIPIMADAEITAQLLLTEDDFLQGVKNLVEQLSRATEDSIPVVDRIMRNDEMLSMERGFQEIFGMLMLERYGKVITNFVEGLIADLREIELVVYETVNSTPLDILNYYDTEFLQNGWTRNFWVKEDAEPTVRLYSFSGSGRMSMSSMLLVQKHRGDETPKVVLLSARLR